MASSTEQQLTSVKIHKIPDIETWKSLYGTSGGIGDGDVVVFDPGVITDRPLNVTFGTKTTLVDTTTLAFAKNTDDKYCTIENPISGFTKNQFQQNKLYIVTWDGVEISLAEPGDYATCTATVINNSTFIAYLYELKIHNDNYNRDIKMDVIDPTPSEEHHC